jgi:hypothetical protein
MRTRHRRYYRNCRFPVVDLLESRRLLSIVVNADNVLWNTPSNIAGTNIQAHTTANDFVNNNANGTSLPFQSDAASAGVQLIRTNAYPDDRNVTSTTNTLAFFDQKVQAILNVGAAPLLIEYVNPGLAYYNIDGTLGTGGDYATNLVWLVKHYLGDDLSGFNIQKQYYEIANEPDLNVDYQVSSWIEYAQIYQQCNDALVAAGLRSHVVLGMGVTSHAFDYNAGQGGQASNLGTLNIKYTLAADSVGSVDNVDYHEYVNSSTADGILNSVNLLDNLENVERTPYFSHSTTDNNEDMGAASLAGYLTELGLSDVGLGVTEFNVGPGTFSHTITQGLWELGLTSFMIKDPSSQLATSFVFDDQGSQGYGIYDASSPPQLDYTYWAMYIRGNLTGNSVLDETTTGNLNPSGNPYLLATATRDSNYIYLEVINRDTTSAISDMLTLNGVGITGNAKIYQMSDNGVSVTPNVASTAAFSSGESYTFPQQSATIFKIPYMAAAGFGLSVNKQYQAVTRGGSQTYTVTYIPQNGFPGTPSFSVLNLPSTITAVVTPAGGNNYTVKLTTTSTTMTQGAYALTVSATVNGQTANVPIWLVATSPDFAVASAPSSITPTTAASVAAGNMTLVRVSVIPQGGFSGTVSLSASGLPSGATISGPMTINTAGYVLLAVTTSASTPVGSYTLQFTGTNGALIHTGKITLNVTAAAAAPTAPTALTATAYADSLVTLAWTNSTSDPTNYSIERSTDGTNFTELIGYNSGNVVTYADVQAKPGTTYYYRVRCLNAAGASSYSNIAVATTPEYSGTTPVVLASLSIAAGAKDVVPPPWVGGRRIVLVVGSLSIAGSTNAWQGQLDLSGNDLIVRNASLVTVTNLLENGFSRGAGYWNGQGIISSTAAANPSDVTTLGVLQPSTSLTAFDGLSVSTNDVLVKYTYYGDADLNGRVDGTDYSLIDTGFASHGSKTGWQNGDFNDDGKIDGSDYSLIDNAFNSQGAAPAASAAVIAKARPLIVSVRHSRDDSVAVEYQPTDEADEATQASQLQWIDVDGVLDGRRRFDRRALLPKDNNNEV